MPGCLFSNQDKAGLKGGVGKLVSHYEIKGLTTDRYKVRVIIKHESHRAWPCAGMAM